MNGLDTGLKLRVGEEIPIKRGWIRKQSLIYAGMTDDRIASVVINNAEAHNSWAYNLFIPRYPYRVTTKFGQLEISHFSPDELLVKISRI